MTGVRLTAEQARDEVQRRIAELEPRVARLKAERRAARIAQRQASQAFEKGYFELRHLRWYLFALAAAVANGEELTYRD